MKSEELPKRIIKNKLTPKQQMVIELLQNGESLTTCAAEPPYQKASASVSCKGKDIQISLRVFWNLVEKGLIYQESGFPFDFVISSKGRDLKF